MKLRDFVALDSAASKNGKRYQKFIEVVTTTNGSKEIATVQGNTGKYKESTAYPQVGVELISVSSIAKDSGSALFTSEASATL